MTQLIAVALGITFHTSLRIAALRYPVLVEDAAIVALNACEPPQSSPAFDVMNPAHSHSNLKSECQNAFASHAAPQQ